MRAFPGLNAGTLAAAIWMVSPVLGLRPVRAARSRTKNVPKPTNATDSAFFNELVTASMVASNARLAAVLEMSADSTELQNRYKFNSFEGSIQEGNLD